MNQEKEHKSTIKSITEIEYMDNQQQIEAMKKQITLISDV